MSQKEASRPPRRAQLLEAAYRYTLEHGLTDLSLRPLAAAVGSSPRVLLYLFGSKDGLVRELLAMARADELAFLSRVGVPAEGDAHPLVTVAEQVWTWLSAPEHRSLLTVWVEAYAHSLVEPQGPWGGFAAGTVEDWLRLLRAADPTPSPGTPATPTAVLALLRGALLDLLATGDVERTTAAVQGQLHAWASTGTPRRG